MNSYERIPAWTFLPVAHLFKCFAILVQDIQSSATFEMKSNYTPPTISIRNTHIKYINPKSINVRNLQISWDLSRFHAVSSWKQPWPLGDCSNLVTQHGRTLNRAWRRPFAIKAHCPPVGRQIYQSYAMPVMHSHEIPRSWWNLKSEHIWLRSICPCLTLPGWLRIAAAAELSKHCSITSCKSTCWSLFNFPGLPSSAETTGHSRSISQNKSSVRASFSACQPPLKNTCINQMPHLYLALPTLRFSTALELKLFLLRHLQKAMNIFSSQDRSLKWNSLRCKINQNHLPTIHCVM